MATSQKLYLLLPNHKCPNKKGCPFHPPEEQEEEDEEAEVTFAAKRRSISVEMDRDRDRDLSEDKLAAKLANINQEINSRLLEAHKLHLPRKTSQDISLASADLLRLRDARDSVYDTETSETETVVVLATSTREQSVTSDFGSTLTLDSGVMFDSWSDVDYVEEESLPLIEEELVIPDVSIVEDLM